ncbi:hypothetical protein [Nocardia jiangsuensis]|uniref:SnoaL-like protein n=1 Tax=Nocardia jiangsuensis TaxID=1691563 RepID=A0ABV8DM83_9NOCA
MLFEEPAPGSSYSAGNRTDAAVAGAFIDWYVSAGVLDGARKARFAEDLHGAAITARTRDDGRLVITSCVIHEVPEGRWAQNGAIRRLPEIASLGSLQQLAAIR